MLDYVIPPPSISAVPVASGGLFPVRRIFCVGRNYAEHTKEMGGDPTREAPFFFTKPADAVLTRGDDMAYPPETHDLHFEVELVVAIGTSASGIGLDQAHRLIWGYAVGIDMTRRDLQAAAKKAGRPWDMAKGFDQSAPIGDLVPVSRCGPLNQGSIELTVNGAVRQRSDLSQMIWSIPETIAALSGLVRLEPGDLIFTGTPAGVGAAVRGDVMQGRVANLPTVRTRLV